MNAICIIAAGVVRATLPAPEFTLAWEHSVEKTRWEERYRIDDAQLDPIEARIQSFGAGMEAPPGAKLQNGWWVWHPDAAPYESLTLTRSNHTKDYQLCWNGRCATLTELVGATQTNGSTVTVRACDASPSPAGPGPR